jgi:Cu/Ag efflux protein CusF
MRLWKAAVLLNLALLVGVGWGYVWWGRQAVRLERELAQLQAQATMTEREWRVDGVVRAVLPDMNVIVLSHAEIPGFMAAMTMGFRTASPNIYDGVAVGDAVRFTVRGTPPNVVITAIEKLPGGERR